METRRKRHRPVWPGWPVWLVAVLVLAAACSSDEEPPAPRADATSHGTSPTIDAATPVSHQAFCREYETKVRLVYTVVSRPTPAGKALSVRLTVHNGSERHLLGDIGGAMAVRVPGASSPSGYEWGDSPDDVIGVRALTTRDVLMSNLSARPLSVPADAKVSVLGLWSRLGPSRTGRAPCSLPALVRAPSGLVLGHPSGHWSLSVRRGERLAERAQP